MKHFEWAFWRIGKSKQYSNFSRGTECRTNAGKWKYLFGGFWYRADSKDYTELGYE